MNCINCDKEHVENYCPNCGERNGVKKITLSSILQDTFVSVTDMDKGFLFNFKTLIIDPQRITFDYINGKRKGILNPISFLILSVTFYLVVITFIKSPVKITDFPDTQYKTIGYEIGKFIRSNFKFFWILTIFPLALSLKLIFKKYNFTEYVAVSSFVVGQVTLVGALSYLFFKFPIIFDPVVYLTMLWFIYRIFKHKVNRKEIYILSFTVLFLFIIQLILILVLIGFLKT